MNTAGRPADVWHTLHLDTVHPGDLGFQVSVQAARRRSAVLLLGSLLVLTLCLDAAEGPAPAPLALGSAVLEVAGTVEIARGGRPPWRAVAVGEALEPGDHLRTRADSRALLRLSDRSTVRIQQRSVVEIMTPAADAGRSRLRLRQGSTYFLNRARPAEIEFETPLATGAIRGTEFLLSVDAAAGTDLVAMVDGQVSLRHGLGELELGGGEQAVIEAGRGARVSPALPLVGLVQWSFHYPGVLSPRDLAFTPAESEAVTESLRAYRSGDLAAAVTRAPATGSSASPSLRGYLAALKLAFGQVEDARTLLAESPPGFPPAAALRTVIAAVTMSETVPKSHPTTCSEHLAASYQSQARFDLDAARSHAAQAVQMDPDFGFAWARLAEMEYCHGRRGPARRALAEARRLSPRHAPVRVLDGFLALDDQRPRQARESFEAAIALDGALAEGWLGRGLASARLGDLEAARRDLHVAVALDPQRSLLRSHLAKAWAAGGEVGLAAKDLRLARDLDPFDPTPWFYSALVRRQQREVNGPVRDLERSVALNDNRSVFRSRLLLDQDLAVRSADLAGLYRDAGLDEVAERAAARAVEVDYGGFAGHLFLARSLNAREDPARFDLRLETARQSELLVANLLAPAGGGQLSQVLLEQDHMAFFNTPPVGVTSLTDYRSTGAWAEAGAVFGQVMGLGYAVDGQYRWDPGFAANTDATRHGYSGQFRQRLTAADSVYLQIGRLEAEGGDVARYYDPMDAVAGLRFHEAQEGSLYAGYHHEWAPGNHTLLLAAHLPDRLTLTNPAPDILFLRRRAGQPVSIRTDPFSSLDFHSDYRLESVELQQVFESPVLGLVAGVRYQSGEVASEATLTRSLSGVVDNSSLTADVARVAGYAQVQWRPATSLRVTTGVTGDHLEYPRNADQAPLTPGQESVDAVLPKAGVTWEAWKGGALRAAWGQALGGLYFDDSLRLEPTQLAGFVTAFRSLAPESVVGLVPGTTFETAGFGVDQQFETGTYMGVSAERRTSEGDRTVGALTNAGPLPVPDAATFTRQRLDYEERSVALDVHQLVGRDWVFGARYRVGEAVLEGRFPGLPSNLPGLGMLEQDERGVLQHLQLTAGWNHPSGWFVQWASNWYGQENSGYEPYRTGDAFWQYDLAAGYLFARRRAEIRLGVLNLSDTDYRLNPLNGDPDIARERTFFATLRLNL
jgi:tetratricopeptide (TPR) repeat protein